MGCSVRILACVDRKVDKLVITDICLNHNHEVSSDLYKQYPEVSLFFFIDCRWSVLKYILSDS